MVFKTSIYLNKTIWLFPISGKENKDMEVGKTNVSFSFSKTSSKIAVTSAFNTEEPETQEAPPSRPLTLMNSIEEEKKALNAAE